MIMKYHAYQYFILSYLSNFIILYNYYYVYQLFIDDYRREKEMINENKT